MPPWDAALIKDHARHRPTPAQLADIATEVGFYRRVLDGGGLSPWAPTSRWCRWDWACTCVCGRCTAAASA